jgi:class 3 adenylate cyclase
MDKALRFRPLINPVFAGIIVTIAFTALWYADPGRIAGFIRERAIDAVQLMFPRLALGTRVLVVDIDARTLASRGSWPLPRSDLARLASIITKSHASVIAFDIFFPGADRHSVRTLASEITALSGDDRISRLLADVPDTDAAFAKSLTGGPTVLGALAANGGKPFSVNMIRSEGVLDEQTAGVAEGIIEPYQPLADAALGLGVLSLFGDEDGRIRRVPLIVSAAGTLAPGLTLEAARIAAGANILSVDARRADASFGSRSLPLQEGAGNAGGAASFAQTRHLKALINRRFEQYLAPDVVREIVARPERLKREGEMREMTALFTDVENFTPMTNRIEPQELIALLDVYFDNLCRLVTEHGGMVDGIVGDAIHAFFNIPLERATHADAALDCGLAIIRFSEHFRREPRAARAGFGRTRIGIETGPAIVGDVGGPQRLNYTAYGDAVIVAARLEAANKLFDTLICLGSGCAGAVRNRRLVPLGQIQLKGMDSMTEVFTVEAALLTAQTTSLRPRAPEPIS